MAKLIKKEYIEIEDEYLYDLEIPKTHNYICEGVVVHNCRNVNAAQSRGLQKLMNFYKSTSIFSFFF